MGGGEPGCVQLVQDPLPSGAGVAAAEDPKGMLQAEAERGISFAGCCDSWALAVGVWQSHTGRAALKKQDPVAFYLHQITTMKEDAVIKAVARALPDPRSMLLRAKFSRRHTGKHRYR